MVYPPTDSSAEKTVCVGKGGRGEKRERESNSGPRAPERCHLNDAASCGRCRPQGQEAAAEDDGCLHERDARRVL